MNTNSLSVLLFTSLVLAGCNKPVANCTDPESQKLVGKLITDEVEKGISNERYSDTQEFIYDKAKIRASLEQIKFDVESVRTVKEDPNSTKKFCSGVLKMTVPTTILTDADKAIEMEEKLKISQYARELSIDDSINVFTKKDVEYSVQPTDDGKELYVELESRAWVNLLDKIVSSALWKPILEVRKANEIQQSQQIKEQAKKELEQLQEKANQAKLEVEKLSAIQNKQNAEKLKQDLINTPVPNTNQVANPELDDFSKVIYGYFSSLTAGNLADALYYWDNPSKKIKSIIKNAVNNGGQYSVSDARLIRVENEKAEVSIIMTSKLGNSPSQNWRGNIKLIMVNGSDWKISSMDMKKN